MAGTVPVWQRSTFTDLADLYKPADVQWDLTTKRATRGAYNPTPVALKVPCIYWWYQNISDPIDETGLAKRPSLLVVDAIWLTQHQACGDLWALICRSPRLPDGSVNDNGGICHIVQGEPKRWMDAGVRNAGHTELRIFTPAVRPAGLPAS